MFPKPYPELNDVVSALTTGMQGILEAEFVGAYLQGAFAVGGFDQDSDADFVTVIEDKPASHDPNALQALHSKIFRLPFEWARHLEGSYFPGRVLRSAVGRKKRVIPGARRGPSCLLGSLQHIRRTMIGSREGSGPGRTGFGDARRSDRHRDASR